MQISVNSQESVIIPHRLWGEMGCQIPFHRAFRSSLCVSVAALLICASTVKAETVDISSSTTNANTIAQGTADSRVVAGAGSQIAGLEITDAQNSGGQFTNTGDISLYYTSESGDAPEVRGMETIESSITLDNSGTITVDTLGSSGVENETIAYGIHGFGDVTNTGTISSTATGGDAGTDDFNGAEAFGIHSDEGDITNSGSISVISTSGDSGFSHTRAAGLLAKYGKVDNSSEITVSAATGEDNNYGVAEAYGIYAYYDVENSGQISVSATSHADGSLNVAFVEGIFSDEGNVNNSGSITVSATSNTVEGDTSISSATGIYAEDDVVNSSEIVVTATSGAAVNFSQAEAYGIESDDGEVINSGSITVTATSGDNADESEAVALGIYAEQGVSNSSSVTVTASSGNDIESSAYAYASGIYSEENIANMGNISATATGRTNSGDSSRSYAYGLSSDDGSVSNSASITVNAQGGSANYESMAQARGISAYGEIVNTGSITVSATGGDTYALSAEPPMLPFAVEISEPESEYYYDGSLAVAFGLSDAQSILNEGAITVTAHGGSGYYGEAFAAGIIDAEEVVNSGDIIVTTNGAEDSLYSYTGASGISGRGNINNSGNITVTASGGNAAYFSSRWASGINTVFAEDTIVNSGNITVTATGGNGGEFSESRAAGILSAFDAGVDNSGNIIVTASTESSSNASYANATGIGSWAGITNSGDITVSARSENTEGNSAAVATGLETMGSYVNNHGTITVTANAGSSAAFGIYLSSSSAEVNSTGLVNATATGEEHNAYQIYSPYGDVTITGFAMEFGGSQEELNARYQGVIGGDGSFTFSEEAVLYVYANNFLAAGTNEYTIPSLLEADVDSWERGYFDDFVLRAASPDYEVLELSERSDEELQTISLRYYPQVSTPQYATQVKNVMTGQTISIVKNSMINPILSHMLAGDPTQIDYDGPLLASTAPIPDASSVITGGSRKKGSFFVQPYFTDTSNDSSPMGYDADIIGLSGGYNYLTKSNLLLGVHAGFGNADIDYTGSGYDQRTEDIDLVTFGVHGIHRFNTNWLLSATSTFFYTSNDYADQLATNLETADYNTYGIETNVEVGYIFSFGNQQIIPGLGLTYLWQHNEGYTTDNLFNADVTYSSMDENELFARLGVSWYGSYSTEEWHIVPNLKIGIEQVLTDGKYSNTLTAGSAVQTVTSDNDDTSLELNAGLEFKKETYSFTAGYTGSYSEDVADNSVFVQALFRF